MFFIPVFGEGKHISSCDSYESMSKTSTCCLLMESSIQPISNLLILFRVAEGWSLRPHACLSSTLKTTHHYHSIGRCAVVF